MAYTPNNPNGSALSASSAPVVIASDQLAISTKDTIVASTIPTATTMQNAAVAIGVGVNLNVQGYSSAIISISGTMSGSTIVFKESPDDVTFNPIAAHQIGISGNLSSTATTVGEYRISCAGLKSLQAVITVFGTGTITVKGFASPLAGHGTTVNANIIASLPAGTATIGNVKLPDVATAGTLAALNATVATPVNSQGAVGIQLTGTWVGTVQFQGTEDPLNISAPTTSWFPVNGVASVSGVQSTTTTTNGQYRVNAGAYVAVRAIMFAYTSGTTTVWMNATVAASMATLAEPLPTGANTIGKVGIDQTVIGSTNNISISASTGAGTSNLVKDDASFGDGVTTGILAVTSRLFNGTAYDRPRGDATNGAFVQVKAIAAGANTIGAVNIAAAQTLATVTTVSAVTAITNALPAGTNTIGKIMAGSSTTGGLTTFTLISAATTNATSIKATAGTVYSLQASNTGAAVAFIKLFNLATAPTVGTSVAVKTLIVPVGGGIVMSTADIGLAFGTGIAISVTGLAATADATAVALSQVVVNIDYV